MRPPWIHDGISHRHAAERRGLDRRAFLQRGVAASASVFAPLALSACNSSASNATGSILARAERFNEGVERALFRHRAISVAPAHGRTAGPRFPSYFVSDDVPVWDEAKRGPWQLEVGGLVRRRLRLTLSTLMALPRTELRLEHFCVEGWSAIAVRTGVRLSELARRTGPTPDAAYVDFQSFDQDYHESWDIESALHPQTLIVFGQDGQLLDPAYGAPARVYSPTKLGYKCTKYLTRITFLPARNGGYWSDRGYEWYGGV